MLTYFRKMSDVRLFLPKDSTPLLELLAKQSCTGCAGTGDCEGED